MGGVGKTAAAQPLLSSVSYLMDTVISQNFVLKKENESLREENESLKIENESLKNENESLKFSLKLAQKTLAARESEIQMLKQAKIRLARSKGGSKSPLKDWREDAYAAKAGASAGQQGDRFQPTPGETLAEANRRRVAKSESVHAVVSEILLHSRDSDGSAKSIVDGIFDHHYMKPLLDRKSIKPSTEELVLDDILNELLESIAKLKNSSRGSTEWHMYQSLLNAIVPEEYDHPQLLADAIGVTYRKVKQVSERKSWINETSDWGIGHVVQTRSDAFRIKHKELIPLIEGFFASQTQQDPARECWDHKKNNHHIENHRRRCGYRHKTKRLRTNLFDGACEECEYVEIWGSGKCEHHPIHYQMMSDDTFYQSFAVHHPEVAEVCGRSLFFSFRPYWVKPPNSRTCMCVHHTNYYFMHDALRLKMKKLHGNGTCECGCAVCDQGAKCNEESFPMFTADKLMEHCLCRLLFLCLSSRLCLSMHHHKINYI
jgi:hypothetical protein